MIETMDARGRKHENPVYGVVAFRNAQTGLRAYRTLRASLRLQVVPTPRALSADCGVALRYLTVDETDLRVALAILRFSSDSWRMYRLTASGEYMNPY